MLAMEITKIGDVPLDVEWVVHQAIILKRKHIRFKCCILYNVDHVFLEVSL
jgi:hypothetical protein